MNISLYLLNASCLVRSSNEVINNNNTNNMKDIYNASCLVRSSNEVINNNNTNNMKDIYNNNKTFYYICDNIFMTAL